MTHEEQIASLTTMLEIQTKLQETAVAMIKPAVDVAYQKGYADAMNWKVQNNLEHLPSRQARAIELLERAENEMRYAGWNKFESDNTARNGVYEQIKEFLK